MLNHLYKQSGARANTHTHTFARTPIIPSYFICQILAWRALFKNAKWNVDGDGKYRKKKGTLLRELMWLILWAPPKEKEAKEEENKLLSK